MIPDNDTLSLRIAERLAFFKRKDDESAAIIADELAKRNEYRIRFQELEWMTREKIDPRGAPVETPTAEIAPREQCAAEIENCLPEGEDLSDWETVRARLLNFCGSEWHPRTVRAALTIIHQRRKKKSSASGSPGETNPPSSPTLESVGAGPGAELSDEFPDTPDFLRRTKKADAEKTQEAAE